MHNVTSHNILHVHVYKRSLHMHASPFHRILQYIIARTAVVAATSAAATTT